MTDESENLPAKLALSVSEPYADLPREILELSIDQIVDGGLLDNVPAVKWIIAAARTAKSVSDRLLFKKLLTFHFYLSQTSAGDRYAVLRQLRENPTFKQKVGENLLLIMEKIDDMEKTHVIARCFSLYLSNYMKHDEYMALASLICRTSMAEIKALGKKRHFDASKIEGGLASGLCEYEIFEAHSEQMELRQKLSQKGHDLRLILMGQFERETLRRRDQQKLIKELFDLEPENEGLT